MRKLYSLISIILVSSLITISAVAAPDDYTDRAETLTEEKEDAEDSLSELQEKLTRAMTNLDKAEIEIENKRKDINNAEEALQELLVREESEEEAMRSRMVYMYENNSAVDKIERIFNANSIASLFANAEEAEALYEYDREKLKDLSDIKESISAYNDDLEKQTAQMEELQQTYESESEELKKLIKNKESEIEDLDRQLQIAAAQSEAAKRWKEMRELAPDEVEGDNPNGEAIVKAAYSQLGVPYVWGGTTPGKALDCSGLTQYCYRCAGVSIPRTSSAQLAAGQLIANPSPGDICWTPGHVAIYIGDGLMIEAQQTGVPVKISPVRVTYYIRFA